MIDESLYTGKYNSDIPNFIQANEACKLLEEGVCSLEECDTAMELGYNMEGPIHYIQRFEPQQIADALNAVADHFGVDYSEKLTEIIRENNIKSVTVVRMEVPCCGGLELAAKKALQQSGKFIPWQVVTVTVDGRLVEE